MKSRELPWSRTLHLTCPPGVTWVEHDDHVAYQADMPLSNFHHRILLDEPPQSMEPWKARWRELNAGRGVEQMMFAWEGRAPAPISEGRCWTLFTLMADQAVDPVEDPRVRLLGPDDLDAMVELFTVEADAQTDKHTWGRWMLEGVLQRENRTLVGVFEGDRLASLATIAWDRKEARFQAVITHPDHRRKGLAALAVTRALEAYQERSFGISYVAASADTPAEALYRTLEFRRVTAVTLVAIDA